MGAHKFWFFILGVLCVSCFKDKFSGKIQILTWSSSKTFYLSAGTLMIWVLMHIRDFDKVSTKGTKDRRKWRNFRPDCNCHDEFKHSSSLLAYPKYSIQKDLFPHIQSVLHNCHSWKFDGGIFLHEVCWFDQYNVWIVGLYYPTIRISSIVDT